MGDLFKRSWRGYDAVEVDKFIDDRNRELSELKDEVESLKTELEKMAGLFSSAQIEKQTEAVMARAKAAADRIVDDAERKASRLIKEARRNAEAIRDATEKEAYNVKEKGERALELRDRMLAEMKQMIVVALQLLDATEAANLTVPHDKSAA